MPIILVERIQLPPRKTTVNAITRPSGLILVTLRFVVNTML
jgi:hypothetical protein